MKFRCLELFECSFYIFFQKYFVKSLLNFFLQILYKNSGVLVLKNIYDISRIYIYNTDMIYM